MENKKNKVGIIVGIIIAILVIIGGTIAFLYLKTDIFKTKQQLFYSYLMQNEQVIEGLNMDNNTKTTRDILKDKQYTTNGVLTVGYKENSQSELNNTKIITLEGKTDELEQQAYSKIKLLNPSNESEELFNLEYLRTNDIYAITSNQVVNLYLAVQNNNLKAFAKKIGIIDVSQIPDKIEIDKLEEKNNLSEEQLKTVWNKYFNLLVEKIPSEKYTKQKNVSIVINEQNYNNLDIYTLTLNQKDLIDVLKPILQQLKEDDETLNIFLELYKTNKTLDDLNELKNTIQETIMELESSQPTDDVAIKINAYTKDKKLIKTQIQLGNAINEGIILDVIPIKTEQETKIIFDVTNIQDENKSCKTVLTLKKDKEIEILFTMQEDVINFNYSEQLKNENTIEKEIGISYSKNENTIKINYNENKTITSNLKIDKLDSNSNCVILNDYPQEALQLLMSQLGERLGQIFTDIGNKIGFFNFIQSYDSKNIQDEMKEQEKALFNAQFMYYDVQNISGTNVKALLSTIISSNKNVDRGVGVTFNSSENKTTEEDINKVISEIELNSNYNVSFEYSDEGYINLVKITQN